ncbi:hypothetical protein VJ923_07155 [Adlercreutzia sp. R25]|uniref:hypothetical protein n=1 Tax=Adlercreutzia shanghongiae TaxID=3111773 RepID=UPI002DB707EF|nr:hypothetical protein [Adlercreutzia sp. R25]MEC4272931.1 hypothetical protein [Adlercreutzia sp. R25]
MELAKNVSPDEKIVYRKHVGAGHFVRSQMPASCALEIAKRCEGARVDGDELVCDRMHFPLGKFGIGGGEAPARARAAAPKGRARASE